MTNKNLHAATTKKGSKMTKKRGSKKGQKWPKMGVQKRVKKRPEIEFLGLLKISNYPDVIINNKHKKKFTNEFKRDKLTTNRTKLS